MATASGHPFRVAYEPVRQAVHDMATAAGFGETLRAAMRSNFRDGAAIGVPVTIAFGNRDRVLLPVIARRRTHLPEQTRCHTLGGCGHIAMFDDPEAVAALLIETSRTDIAANPAARVRWGYNRVRPTGDMGPQPRQCGGWPTSCWKAGQNSLLLCTLVIVLFILIGHLLTFAPLRRPTRRMPGRSGERKTRSRPGTVGLLTMASIVLRVRLMTGDRLDVTYEEADTGDVADVVAHAVAALADSSGIIRAKHGDRVVVLYGRGVAAIEVEPRGAVL